MPIVNGLLPPKLKSPFQFCGLFVLMTTPPPKLLSIAPPVIVRLPVPMAAALLMFNVPALTVVLPAYVLALVMVTVPLPLLTREPVEMPKESTLCKVYALQLHWCWQRSCSSA